MSSLPRLFQLHEIQKEVESESFRTKLIEGIQEGFRAYHNGAFNAPPIQTMGAPPMDPFCNDDDDNNNYAAQTCVKSGYFRNNPYYVVKVASGGHPLPNSGCMQIYSQKTGRLEAILLDDGLLTDLRTAAVGALAVKLLAPKSVNKIGIVGTGIQARFQLEFISLVLPSCRDVLVWGRTSAKVNKLINEYPSFNIKGCNDADQLLRECSVIVTTTPAREPILGNSGSVPPEKGCLIICIGSDAPGKGELNDHLLDYAHFRVADSIEQTVTRGEFQKWASTQERKGMIQSLGCLIESPGLQRKDEADERMIIFDSSGVALQDCVIAQIVYESLMTKQTGQSL